MSVIFSSKNWETTSLKESFIVNLPFYHMLGFGLMNISLIAGATSVVMEKFDPKIFLEGIQKYRVRAF